MTLRAPRSTLFPYTTLFRSNTERRLIPTFVFTRFSAPGKVIRRSAVLYRPGVTLAPTTFAFSACFAVQDPLFRFGPSSSISRRSSMAVSPETARVLSSKSQRHRRLTHQRRGHSCCPGVSRGISFESTKTAAVRAFTPSPHSGNQWGAETGPQGGLPTDVSELRGGVHLRLHSRRRRNQRQAESISRTARCPRPARDQPLGTPSACISHRLPRKRLLRRFALLGRSGRASRVRARAQAR